MRSQREGEEDRAGPADDEQIEWLKEQIARIDPETGARMLELRFDQHWTLGEDRRAVRPFDWDD